MPEPTTTATRNAVPQYSARTRRPSGAAISNRDAGCDRPAGLLRHETRAQRPQRRMLVDVTSSVNRAGEPPLYGSTSAYTDRGWNRPGGMPYGILALTTRRASTAALRSGGHRARQRP